MPDASLEKARNDMTLKRMDNVGIVVESLDAAISFFAELGLTLEGRATIEGAWAGRVTGLGNQRVEIAMLVTPDGHSRLELSRFLTPPIVAITERPVNALGYLRVMFTVDDIDETLVRLRRRGAQLVAKWFSTKRRIASATSVAPRDFSSDSPRSSSPVTPHRQSSWRQKENRLGARAGVNSLKLTNRVGRRRPN